MFICASSSGDRVAHSECEGRGFDSRLAHQEQEAARSGDFLCILWKAGIGPAGREREPEAPVELRAASGPQATERGAKEAACKREEGRKREQAVDSRLAHQEQEAARSGGRCYRTKRVGAGGNR